MDYSDFPLHSWSLRKERMMERCPRSALFHYALCRGGSDEAADRRTRELYALRSLLSLEEFLDHLLRDAMRFLFYEAPDDSPLALEEEALRRFSREFHQMLSGDPLRFKTPFLRELLRKEESPGALARRGENELRRKISLIREKIWSRLTLVPAESRRYLPSPLRVQINDLPCFCAPCLAWEETGEFWIIQLGAADDAAAFLYRFHALNTAGISPERLRCFTLSSAAGELAEFGLFADFSAELRRIETGAARWKEVLSRPWRSFPRHESFCPRCDYQNFCRDDGSGEPPDPAEATLS